MIGWHHFYTLFLILVSYISVCNCVSCEIEDCCSCRLSSTKELISLWGIDDPNHAIFKNIPVEGTNELLEYNPCTEFTSDGTGNCDDVLVCVHDKDSVVHSSAGNPEAFDTDIESDMVIFKYIGMEHGSKVRETEVTLVCKPELLKPEITAVVKNNNNKTYSFELKSHCACPGACPIKPPDSGSNMSVGSILVTIFFVMLGAYFIFGHLFLKYHRNLDGESAIPNYEFWKELPTNIKEGFIFTRKMVCGTEEGYENI